MLVYSIRATSGTLERFALACCREIGLETIELNDKVTTINKDLVPLITSRAKFPRDQYLIDDPRIYKRIFKSHEIEFPKWAPEARLMIVLNAKYTHLSLGERAQRESFKNALRTADKKFRTLLKTSSIDSLPRLMPEGEYKKNIEAIAGHTVPKLHHCAPPSEPW